MQAKDRYTWEAEAADGALVTAGGDLRGCRRFSLIPQAPGLPQHDIVGVPMVKRFCRSFTKTHLNQRKKLPGKFFWADGSPIVKVSADPDTDPGIATEILAPGDWVGKGVDGEHFYPVAEVGDDYIKLGVPYRGKSKPNGMQAKQLLGVGDQKVYYYHCVETKHIRLWIDYQTGAVLTTPKTYDHYI